jgi:hypothetical protein
MRILSLLTVAAAAATVISSPPAQATIRLADDPGGLIAAYQHKFVRARATGERIVIDGSCLSACTLAVGLVPREQICATPKAVLGFHAAWQPTPWGGRAVSGPATQHMMNIYPADLQGWINARGGLTPHMIFLKGPELAAMVPACSETDIAAARTTRVAHHRSGRPGPGRMIARGPRFRPIYAVRPPMPMMMPMY